MSKMLDIKLDKSVYLLLGKKKKIEKLRQEIKMNPIRYKETLMKEKKEDKWLGDMLNGEGEKQSVLATINERIEKIYNIISETVAIIEDTRMNKLGGLSCAIDIWEIAIIPSLLNNCETWSSLDEKSNTALEGFQSNFLRSILQYQSPALFLHSAMNGIG